MALSCRCKLEVPCLMEGFMRLLLCLCCLLWLIPAGAVKPRVPVVLTWDLIDQSADERHLVLTVNSALETAELLLRVQLPPGARLEAGELRWQGRVDRGEHRLLSLQIVGGSGPLRALAEVDGGDGIRQRAEAVYSLEPVSAVGMGRRREKAPAAVWSEHDGRGVWEYRVRTP